MTRMALLVVAGVALTAACDESPADVGDFAPAFSTNTSLGDPQGTQTAVFPSTNAINFDNGWAHVLFHDVAVGQVTLNFVQPRGFAACFEYRIDGAPAPTGSTNYNPGITDGLYDFTCQNASSALMTITANEYVDVRMGFGAETDERFDWTRFYVLSLENRDQCRDGAWEALGFRNLGQCVRFVETGKDSRTGG